MGFDRGYGTEYDKSSGSRPKYLTQGVTFADVNSLAAKAALDQKAEEDAGQQVEP